ncbi:hypothetical protein GPALN_004850 [Globodera pallida]|nr:hypothetical protein GPALN_004850 [Globodera pallida]
MCALRNWLAYKKKLRKRTGWQQACALRNKSPQTQRISLEGKGENAKWAPKGFEGAPALKRARPLFLLPYGVRAARSDLFQSEGGE